MTKRRGPLLIDELTARFPSNEPNSKNYNLNQARSAYAFISKDYREPETTSSKSITKWQQTDNKPITELATNRQQTDNKVATQFAPNSETDNKPITQPITHSITKWQQTDNKPITKLTFSGLVGLQRSIVIFLYESCKFSRGNCSEALSLEHIASTLESTSGSVKMTLQRLEKKGLISRVEFKNGRGGWSKYQLPESIFHELLQLETGNKLITNRQQTDNKLITQPITQPITSPLSSSSSNLINLTTTTDHSLTPEWEQVRFESLAEIGFRLEHLQQIIQKQKLSPEQVQDSIDAFAFDLRHNNKRSEIKTTEIRYLMGKLVNGEVYIPPRNYLSPQQESMQLYVERMRFLREKAQAIETAATEFAFENWHQDLSTEQQSTLLPKALRDSGDSFRREFLRSHFESQVWPQMRQDFK